MKKLGNATITMFVKFLRVKFWEVYLMICVYKVDKPGYKIRSNTNIYEQINKREKFWKEH